MRMVCIENTKRVKKTKKELQQELSACKNEMLKDFISEYKNIPSKEPTYLVEMSMKELQLVSFYLELEKRKPITNVKLETRLIKGEKQ